MGRREQFGKDMDFLPHQEEVYVSLTSPPELIGYFEHKPNIRTDDGASIQPQERPMGRPPVDIRHRMRYYQKKWAPRRGKLRKREELRLKKAEQRRTKGPTRLWLYV